MDIHGVLWVPRVSVLFTHGQICHGALQVTLMIFLIIIIDDAFFQSELGWSVWGSLGRTKTADGLNWRMLDCLGWGRIAAILVYRL